MPGYRTDDVRVVLKKLVENLCCTTGRSNGTDGEVEGAQIRVRGAMARLTREVQLRPHSDFRAVEERSSEFLDEIAAIPNLRLRFDPPSEVPECSVYIVLKEYTIFSNIDIVKDMLDLGVTREHFDVLPNQTLRDVVN